MSQILANQLELATSEEVNPIDQAACRRATRILFKHYPGHEWHVAIDGGLMKIRSMNLSTNYGYVIRLDEMDPSPEGFDKPVMRAGGEILERYGMPAQKMDIQIWQDLPRDLRGIPEKDAS